MSKTIPNKIMLLSVVKVCWSSVLNDEYYWESVIKKNCYRKGYLYKHPFLIVAWGSQKWAYGLCISSIEKDEKGIIKKYVPKNDHFGELWSIYRDAIPLPKDSCFSTKNLYKLKKKDLISKCTIPLNKFGTMHEKLIKELYALEWDTQNLQKKLLFEKSWKILQDDFERVRNNKERYYFLGKQ